MKKISVSVLLAVMVLCATGTAFAHGWHVCGKPAYGHCYLCYPRAKVVKTKPVYYVQPQPVIVVQPQPVYYVQPQPVVVVQPQPVYVQPTKPRRTSGCPHYYYYK